MNNEEWTENLKVGDEVVHFPKYRQTPEIVRISRLTNSSIFVVFETCGRKIETRFHRKGMCRSVGGDSLNATQIDQITDHLRARIKEENIRHLLDLVLSELDLTKLSLPQVEAILSILNEAQP